MEDPGGESLDGSSTKPVSSLRSHFEQMTVPNRNSNVIPRASSPKSASIGLGLEDARKVARGGADPGAPIYEGHQVAKGREVVDGTAQRQYHTEHTSNGPPSPSRNGRSVVTSPIPPAVNVLPPQSPPKARGLNWTLASTSPYLSADASSPSLSSPTSRNFRISSRPHTPLLEPRKSPSLPPFQPPSPPPPRGSGELRRDDLSKAPPPVKRTDKPKVGIKPISLALGNEGTKLVPQSPAPSHERRSPFSTPPSSDEGPEPEIQPPALPRPRPVLAEPSVSSPTIPKAFAPPPIHHSIASKRRDHEANDVERGPLSPNITGNGKPALPMRPSAAPQSSMPPPPPRPSMDRTRSAVPHVMTAKSATTSMPPPKRIASHPVTQIQTPTRSHGRSMTVDRSSDRTPQEFRTPALTLAQPSEGRMSFDSATPFSQSNEAPNSNEYPESFNSNRREPYMKLGAREISTKYDTRMFDVCGEFVCTSGHLTRVWSLLDGEIVMSLAHTEGVKIISLAFKPSPNVKDEGTRVWLGNNIGEIMEVEVATQSIVAIKNNAHTRREIIKMYRHRDQMWTLDDGGTLHLWAPDTSGSPSLTNPYQSFRLPKGHTFSLLVAGELWHATGKDIRIFMPTLDGASQFQVLQRPLNQPGTGDVTSGTTISDRVYFGHVDGKISLYSRHDYACLGVVNISVYKITSLAVINGNLWAGFSTGMIYVYDTSRTPWVVKKDWRAHHDPLLSLVADRSSFWKLDRAQIISLGQDNMLRIWDGLLQDDWLEAKMQSQEANFCSLQPIKALVMTWNAGASTPYHLQHSDQDAAFFRDLFQSSDSPDILVFGFQELVDLEDKKTTAKSFSDSFFKSKKKDKKVSSEQENMSHQYRDWRDFLTRCLDDYMPRNELYQLLHTATLVGLFTCVFVKASLRERIRGISEAKVKRGMGGLHGNKGALILRFILDDTSMCFINCHLAAGQTQTKDRNTDIAAILESALLPAERDLTVRQDSFVGGGDGTMILDHEICLLNGDMNYRIDTMGRDTVVNAVKANNFNKLLDRDQLLASKRRNPWFRLRAFNELPITFAPTYKYDVGTDTYDSSEKKRAPAWCDRILYRGRDRIQQLDYRRHEVRVSDHRPVTGLFSITIKSISPKQCILKWEECQQNFAKMKAKIGTEARLDYLTNLLGFDLETSKEIIAQGERSR